MVSHVNQRSACCRIFPAASGVGLNFMLEEKTLQAEELGQVALWPGGRFPIELSLVYRTKNEHSSRLQAVKNCMATIWPQVAPCFDSALEKNSTD